MFVAVNAWTFPDNRDPTALIDSAADAGFAGLELVVDAAGPLCPTTPVAVFADLARRAADRDLRLVGLATRQFWETNYADPDPAVRAAAHELTLQLLDRAAAAGAGAVLVVPAVVGCAPDARPRVTYADALHYTAAGLAALRPEAEARAVTLAIENVWNRFLLSPVEAADLLDHVNSPHVGFYLDVGNVLAVGYPEDWITTLGGRLARVHVKDYDLTRPGPTGFCPLGEGSVNWPGVMSALRSVGYDGPLTYEGPGDPRDIHQRLARILEASARRDPENRP